MPKSNTSTKHAKKRSILIPTELSQSSNDSQPLADPKVTIDNITSKANVTRSIDSLENDDFYVPSNTSLKKKISRQEHLMRIKHVTMKYLLIVRKSK